MSMNACLCIDGDNEPWRSVAVQFVLDCITLIPLIIGHFVIKKVCLYNKLTTYPSISLHRLVHCNGKQWKNRKNSLMFCIHSWNYNLHLLTCWRFGKHCCLLWGDFCLPQTICHRYEGFGRTPYLCSSTFLLFWCVSFMFIYLSVLLLPLSVIDTCCSFASCSSYLCVTCVLPVLSPGRCFWMHWVTWSARCYQSSCRCSVVVTCDNCICYLLLYVLLPVITGVSGCVESRGRSGATKAATAAAAALC